MITEHKLAIGFGSISFLLISYIYYVKNCYKYLKSIGYDSPPPKFFLGNLTEFASKENSNSKNKPIISHYSKTLRRWTKTYGKIYGYYEGHSPVIVIADPDLVTEVFVNQSKLVSHRRSFPMSKKSTDPNADIFNRWIRVRYGLEKVILNNKNIAYCLRYADESFLSTFINNPILNKLNSKFDAYNNVRLLMVQTMFSVVFGTDLRDFFNKIKKTIRKNGPIDMMDDLGESENNKVKLELTKYVAHKFSESFEDFEKFSLLKFSAMMIPELERLWVLIGKFKRFFNSHFFRLNYFADSMDWFYENFIEKNVLIYAAENKIDVNENGELNQKNDKNLGEFSSITLKTNSPRYLRNSTRPFNDFDKKFNYFHSFLYLTCNKILKYNAPNSANRPGSVSTNASYSKSRAFSSSSTSTVTNSKYAKIRSNSSSIHSNHLNNKTRINSSSLINDLESNYFNKMSNNVRKPKLSSESVTESEDFENWKLTINEALNNTLLMFFAGYETTSSAISFCVKVLATLPEQRNKLIEEINENWKELSVNLYKYRQQRISSSLGSNEISASENDDEILDDDVFETNLDEKEINGSIKKKNLDEMWDELYDTLDKMKYLDMFIREVLRMFPIANSMVSRKCVVDDLTIDGGNYHIPKGMNIVVDVLSIHYDKTIWGPVDPEIFYPERFLTERNPSAWLAFGIGCRKCLAQKLAMSQIKLFIVRLLQNYVVENAKGQNSSENELNILNNANISNLIETQEILFNSPIEGIYISIDRKDIENNLTVDN